MFLLAGCTMLMLTDYGWQKTPSGEVEYVIQIEPELLDSLRRGEEIVSTIPPRLGKVTRFRIRVGRAPVPKDASLLAADGAPEPPVTGPPPATPLDDSHRQGEPVEQPGFQPPPLIAPSPTAVPPRTEAGDAVVPLGGTEARKDRPKPIPRTDPGHARTTPRFPPLPFRTDAPASPVRPATVTEPEETTARRVTSDQNALASDDHPSTERRVAARRPSSADVSTDAALAAHRPTRNVATKGEGNGETARPWGVLVLTSLLLFASIGLNVYLGWIAHGALQRYRAVARQLAGELA